MIINEPCVITSRLLPGVRVGQGEDAGEVSIEYAKRDGRDGRARYQWHIDIAAGEFSGDDLQSGCGGGSLQEGLESLLSFLGAAAESCRYKGMEGENANLFPQPVVEWACQNSDELGTLACELEEKRGEVLV